MFKGQVKNDQYNTHNTLQGLKLNRVKAKQHLIKAPPPHVVSPAVISGVLLVYD